MAKSSKDTGKRAAIEGERRQLVLVFVDVVGSTELSTKMDSEDFADLMLEFQSLGRSVFEHFGGHVAHYLGDGLLVSFGYPQAKENDAERAVRAAFDLLGRIRDLSTKNASARLQARVGIHSGTVVVGSSADGSGGILLGEAVNVAARIQSAADPGTVFASEDALRLLKGKFAARAQDAVTLKGLSQEVVLHHILRRTPHKRAGAGPATETIGQAAYLSQLAEAMDLAKDGQRTGVSVTGEPGLGKTTLIDGFRSGLALTPHIWLEARCDVLQTGASLHPFIDLMRRSLGILDHHNADECARRLTEGLAVWADRPAHAFPVIAQLLGITVPEHRLIATQSPESLRGMTLETIMNWIEFLTTLRPVVLICEDVHWSDATTLDCLNLLLARDSSARLLCITTARPGQRGLDAKRLRDRIELRALSDEDAQMLIHSIAGTGQLDAGTVERVIERGQGVPLFLEELTRQALKDGSPDGAGVPQSLDGLVMQQIDSLPPDAKATAQLAAALGETFDYGILASVSDLDAFRLDTAMEALLEADVLRHAERKPASYIFRHALTRDGAYGTMLRPRRMQIHADTARCLMSEFRQMGEMRPAVVAYHLLMSGQFQPAAEWFRTAGWNAAQQAAVEDATTLYRRALSALENAPDGRKKNEVELSLQILLGNALMGVRGFGSDEIVPVWERALNLAEDLKNHDERSSALNGLAAYWIGKGDSNKACDFAQKILTWSDPANHRIGRLRAHSSLANAKLPLGAVVEARDHAEVAISIYRPEDFSNVTYGVGTDQGVVAYGAAAASHWWLGATETGLKRARSGVALAEGLESALSLAAAKTFLALIHYYRGEEALAYEVADETVAFCEHLGIPFWKGVSLILRAGPGIDAPARRLRDVESGLAIMASAGSQSAVALGFSIMASAQTANGSPDVALGILKTGAQVSAFLGQHFWDVELARQTAEIQLTMGAAEDAAKTLDAALATAREQNAQSLALRTALALFKVPGQQDAARTAIASALKGMEPGSSVPDAKRATELLSTAYS